jgi:predicted PurR-regulated permease PerM
MVNLSGKYTPEDISSNLILYKQINMMNKNNYNLIFFIFLVLLLLSVGILIIDNFFIHQSILELQDLHKEINDKFEYLEKNQKEKLEIFENTIIQELNDIENHQKTIKNNPVRERNEAVDLIVGVGLYIIVMYYIISSL